MVSGEGRMEHPFTVAEFRELVSLALEAADPGRHIFSPAQPRSFFSIPPRPFFAIPPRPPPMNPLGAPSHLDLSHTCMTLQSPSSRPKSRQVFAKIKQQASAFVKTPTIRLRSRSCNEDDARILPSRPAPTVTFANSVPRARSASYVSYASAVTTASLLPDASLSSDFVPYIPLAIRLERESHSVSCLPSKRPVLPPSPSLSMRSISTTSTQSPVTPVFTHHNHDTHLYTSAAAVMSPPWSTPSDDPDNQNSDSFSKAKVQIVRRSLVRDSFLLACAAVDDDGGVNRSSKISRRPANAPLPPLKPPPSCPLPSPPPVLASAPSIISLSTPDLATTDEEWTLFLGAPSKPLELAKEHVRERAKSSPSVPSRSKQHHLSPPHASISFKVTKEAEPVRTRTVSARSMATTRRIESGPGGQCFEDWTLSLPLPRKSGASSEKATTSLEVPAEPQTRKCKSFTDWTTSLSEEYEKEERRLAELEQRERERERKLSRVSLASTKSARASLTSSSASIRSSTFVKKQLPIGPGSNDSHSINLNPAATTSAISLHSVTSTLSTHSNKHSAPPTPISPNYVDSIGWVNSPHYVPRLEQALASSASTSVTTLAKFPLPPSSVSSKLLQRRQAVSSMPRPLMPTTSLVLRKQFGSPTSFVVKPQPTSAPAGSPNFPVGQRTPATRTSLGVPSPLRRTRSYGMTASTTDGVNVTRWNSSRTTSSAATVKMPISSEPANYSAGAAGSGGENAVEKSSLECYETCDEGSLSPVAISFQAVSDPESMRSSCDVFYSARSSINV